MQLITALVAGALFGAGLTVAQMVDPQKVLNFLDVAAIAKGTWDPTLLMVFAGALPTMFIADRIRRLRMPGAYLVPLRSDIDARLVGGSAIFGVGWGLAGVCPGPAISALVLAGGQVGNVVLFVAAMLAGIMLSWLLAPGATVATAAEAPTASA
jgi:hypothetical protein